MMAKTPNPIKLRRLAVGLTSAEVAECTGGQIYPKLLSRSENGHITVESRRKGKFAALAAVLGLSEPELLTLATGPTDDGTVPTAPPVPPAGPSAPVLPDVHEKRRTELERSVDIGISKMRDELQRMNEHLRFLEAELERLRLR